MSVLKCKIHINLFKEKNNGKIYAFSEFLKLSYIYFKKMYLKYTNEHAHIQINIIRALIISIFKNLQVTIIKQATLFRVI